MNERQTRRLILRKMNRIRRKLRENIACAEWWAQHRPAEPPLDCEADRVALHKIEQARTLFKAGRSHEVPALLDEVEAALTAKDESA